MTPEPVVYLFSVTTSSFIGKSGSGTSDVTQAEEFELSRAQRLINSTRDHNRQFKYLPIRKEDLA